MSPRAPPFRPAAAASIPADATPGAWRGMAFLMIYWLVWISVQPFENRADPSVLDPSGGGNLLNQVAYLAAAAGSVAFLYGSPGTRVRLVITPVLAAMVLWFAVSILVSADPSQSARRLTLFVLVMVVAVGLLQLPRTGPHFAALMAGGTLFTLFLCYAGLVLLPGLAIHQASDLLEPQLVGSWRGVFTHKNEAGAAMSLFIFIGLFVSATRSRLLGNAIVVLSIVFLVFTQAKSSFGLSAVAFAVAAVLTRIRSLWIGMTIVGALLALFNLFTVGSAVLGPVHSIVAAVLPDPTFTGRDEIWRYALDRLAERPLSGHGFQAFWRTGDVIYSGEGRAFAQAAPHAHNGYLDIALTTGVPGLVLFVLWLVMQPLRDLRRLRDRLPDRPLALLFARIWLFSLLFLCLESVFFNSRSPIWFMTVVAVCGLRLLATARATR